MFAIMSLKFAWVVAILTVLVTLPFTCARAVLEERDDNLPARVPYVFPPPGTDALADDIRSRRDGGVLLDLDGILLNDENLATAWNGLASMIRGQNTIPADMRELFILRTGVLNEAAYVWLQHESVARSVGFTTTQLREIRFRPAFAPQLNPTNPLNASQNAAMLMADFMTKNVNVPQNVFDGLKKFLSNKQMVDAVATVGTYNLVARFVEALDIDSKANVPVPTPQ